ncbi:hypothetical protein [Nocardia cyriacigeorgica]|nr:hypothetical protein [Nocardia cyriacigeorgica]
MSTITAVVSLTLDEVKQAPGRTDEGPHDGFTPGGWAHHTTDRS